MTIRLLLALLLALPCAGPAAAHFVWLEPASDDGPVQASFGDFRVLRESGPVLDKIAKVAISAVTPAGRTALTTTRGAAGFEAAGAPTAPVYAASLDYGIVRRDKQTPFSLQYHALYLRGDGQPLSLAKIGELTRLASGLPLVVTAEPQDAGHLALTVTRDGRPRPATVTARVPGQFDEAQFKTDAAGRVVVPVLTGWNGLRVLDEQPDAKVAGADDVKLIKTYVTLSFQAALQTDPASQRLVQEAHDARAAWGKDFPGFTAAARLVYEGAESNGTITVKPDYQINYEFEDPRVARVLSRAFASLVMHRQGGGETPVFASNFVDDGTHPYGRAVALHEGGDSVFRVRDKQILQVVRVSPNGWFVIDNLENEATPGGQYLPRMWTVTYYDKDGAISSNATTSMAWAWVGKVFVPAEMRRAEHRANGTESPLVLTLTNHKLLP